MPRLLYAAVLVALVVGATVPPAASRPGVPTLERRAIQPDLARRSPEEEEEEEEELEEEEGEGDDWGNEEEDEWGDAEEEAEEVLDVDSNSGNTAINAENSSDDQLEGSELVCQVAGAWSKKPKGCPCDDNASCRSGICSVNKRCAAPAPAPGSGATGGAQGTGTGSTSTGAGGTTTQGGTATGAGGSTTGTSGAGGTTTQGGTTTGAGGTNGADDTTPGIGTPGTGGAGQGTTQNTGTDTPTLAPAPEGVLTAGDPCKSTKAIPSDPLLACKANVVVVAPAVGDPCPTNPLNLIMLNSLPVVCKEGKVALAPVSTDSQPPQGDPGNQPALKLYGACNAALTTTLPPSTQCLGGMVVCKADAACTAPLKCKNNKCVV